MSRCIVTGYVGEAFRRVFDLTSPRMKEYAARHGAEFSAYLLSGVRLPSWMKLVAMADALSEHDEILWIDADVLIVDSSENIFDAVPKDAWQALVCHTTSEGDVPNCGIWLVRRKMLRILVDIAMDDRFLDHKWWEQAALLVRMGFDPMTPHPEDVNGEGRLLCRAVDKENELHKRTCWLDESWNAWTGTDYSRVEPRFMHACGCVGRHEEFIRFWIKQSDARRRLCATPT